jgi:hypothetical protein
MQSFQGPAASDNREADVKHDDFIFGLEGSAEMSKHCCSMDRCMVLQQLYIDSVEVELALLWQGK